MLWAPWKMNGRGRAKKHTETGSAFPGLAVQNNTVPRDKMPEHRDYHTPCRGGESAYRPRKGRPWDGLAIGHHHCRRGKDVRGFPFNFYRLTGPGSSRILQESSLPSLSLTLREDASYLRLVEIRFSST